MTILAIITWYSKIQVFRFEIRLFEEYFLIFFAKNVHNHPAIEINFNLSVISNDLYEILKQRNVLITIYLITMIFF